MRQVVLDTETTGIGVAAGHRIIEIGAREIVNRRVTQRKFHRYLNPQRPIDARASEVHGIRDEDLVDEPLFRDIADELLEFVADAEVIIHNADFDVGFLNRELEIAEHPLPRLEAHCRILDTLSMARELHPGQRNSLDALCRRYQVDNTQRELHGALLDADLLANVYLAMTGGQASLTLAPADGETTDGQEAGGTADTFQGVALQSIAVDAEDLVEHERLLEKMEQAAGQPAVWTTLTAEP